MKTAAGPASGFHSALCILHFALLAILLCPSPALALVNLRVVETRHYRIRTDLDREFADELAARLDGMYDEYDRRLSEFKRDDPDALFEAYLLKNRDEYIEYGGMVDLRFTSGCYIPNRDVLAAYLGPGGRDDLRKTLQHEAFHQFAAHAIGGDLPNWLNEGLAQWFEEGLWAGDHFLFDQIPPARLRRLRWDIGKEQLIPFDKLLLMSNGRWYLNMANEQLGQLQYNQSWAMAQFLIDAPDDRGNPKYRARLIRLLRLVHDGKTADEAFRAAFSDNVAGFRDRFVDYAATLKPSDAAVMIDRQIIVAHFLIELDRAHVHVDTVAQLREAVASRKLQLTGRPFGLPMTTEPDPSIYFCDPEGTPLPAEQLYFAPAADAPLPDVICRFGGAVQLRTRFYKDHDRTACEVVTEAAP